MNINIERKYFELTKGCDFLFYTHSPYREIEYVTLVISCEVISLDTKVIENVIYSLSHHNRKEAKTSLIHHLMSVKAICESAEEGGKTTDIKLDYYHLQEGDQLLFRIFNNNIGMKVGVRATIIEHLI